EVATVETGTDEDAGRELVRRGGQTGGGVAARDLGPEASAEDELGADSAHQREEDDAGAAEERGPLDVGDEILPRHAAREHGGDDEERSEEMPGGDQRLGEVLHTETRTFRHDSPGNQAEAQNSQSCQGIKPNRIPDIHDLL